MNGDRGDRPQRVPRSVIIVTAAIIAVVVGGIAIRVAMGWRMWPWSGSGPFPGF